MNITYKKVKNLSLIHSRHPHMKNLKIKFSHRRGKNAKEKY